MSLWAVAQSQNLHDRRDRGVALSDQHLWVGFTDSGPPTLSLAHIATTTASLAEKRVSGFASHLA